MKMQKLEWAIEVRKLIPLMAHGRLNAELTEPFAHGTYLEAWFRCLKCSKEFTHSCRTGIFPSKKSFETYVLFGPLEDLNFGQWWAVKGHAFFGQSITALQVRPCTQRHNALGISMVVDSCHEIPNQQAAREFGFWVDQIVLLNTHQGLLSEAPLAWPIFTSRISYEAISQLVSIVEIHDQIVHNAPQTKLWQIGEQLRLNPKAMPRASDFPSAIAEKHRIMGQTVSCYLKKGRGLVDNACNGLFPKYWV